MPSKNYLDVKKIDVELSECGIQYFPHKTVQE